MAKKLSKKAVKSKVKRDLNESFEYELFYERGAEWIDRLFDIYKADKVKCRAIYTQNKTSYWKERIVLFKYKNGDFNICLKRRTYGISKTNKMYNKEITVSSVIYKKETNRFWFRSLGGTKLVQLHYDKLREFSRQAYDIHIGEECVNKILNCVEREIPWMRFIREEPLFYHVSFNTIIINKLYSKKDLLRHMYGVSYPTANMLSTQGENYYPINISEWKRIKQYLTNPDHVTLRFMTNEYLNDMIKFSEALGKKINPRWSNSRIKLEHDKWSKELTKIILEFEELRELNVAEVYKEFQKFSGFEMLTTNHDLIGDGLKMNHCVGTYSSSVDNGICAIFKVNGGTLDVRYIKPTWGSNLELAKSLDREMVLTVYQFKDYSNKEMPDDIRKIVLDKVLAFNESWIYTEVVEPKTKKNDYDWDFDDALLNP